MISPYRWPSDDLRPQRAFICFRVRPDVDFWPVWVAGYVAVGIGRGFSMSSQLVALIQGAFWWSFGGCLMALVVFDAAHYVVDLVLHLLDLRMVNHD